MPVKYPARCSVLVGELGVLRERSAPNSGEAAPRPVKPRAHEGPISNCRLVVSDPPSNQPAHRRVARVLAYTCE